MLDQCKSVAHHVRDGSEQILQNLAVVSPSPSSSSFKFSCRIEVFEVQEFIDAGVVISHGGAQEGLDVGV